MLALEISNDLFGVRSYESAVDSMELAKPRFPSTLCARVRRAMFRHLTSITTIVGTGIDCPTEYSVVSYRRQGDAVTIVESNVDIKDISQIRQIHLPATYFINSNYSLSSDKVAKLLADAQSIAAPAGANNEYVGAVVRG